jgi:predicted 3-demethylubiquinone-9 3-methyltransferase (glyoxalase superfamily)
MAKINQKIVTHLVFNKGAEDAVNFYTSIFQDSSIISSNYFSEGDPGAAGTVCSIRFKLSGQDYWAVNGGEYFKFSEAISLYVRCENQEELDLLWEKLSDGGEIQMCGWLKDRFGVSWQLVPYTAEEMLSDKDPDKIRKVMHAIFKMTKIDFAALEKAYA